MHRFLTPLLSATLALPALGLAPGDEVTVDSIGKAEFVKGAAPASWEKGELYVIECWATWCGPCIAAIPHVDELFDKYHEKGLNVIGMNVWEDGKDKVAKFVEDKGDGMSYDVAYVGKDGEFQKTWLEAAGVRGIPHAFLVKDGKFLFSTHPSSLTEETIEGILAGGDEEKAIVDKIQQAEANKGAIQEQLQAFMKGNQSGDTEAMSTAIAEIEKLDPDYQNLGRMRTDLAVAKKDWDGAAAMLKAIDDERAALITAAMIAQKTDGSADEPPAVLLEPMAEALNSSAIQDPSLKAMLARVHWKLGNKEQAVASAKEAAANPGRMPKEPLEAFAASFEGGEPQSMQDLMEAVQAAMQAQQQGQ